MKDYSGYLGYVKIKGAGIENGIIGARSGAHALAGLNEALKYFIKKQDADLSGVEFEIPVKVEEGSWEMLIPHTIGMWFLDGGSIVATTFLSKAASNVADNTFKDKDFKQIVSDALSMMKSVAAIAKHRGKVADKKIDGVKFSEDGKSADIPNDDGATIHVTRAELEAYLKCPEMLLSDLVSAIEKDQTMAIAVIDKSGRPDEEQISYEDREAFVHEKELVQPEVLFPELVHGKEVELTGYISKGNKNTNTIGIEYEGHVLTCKPYAGSIVAYKDDLFKVCRIRGTVTRVGDPMMLDTRKPQIRFADLEVVEDEGSSSQLSIV